MIRKEVLQGRLWAVVAGRTRADVHAPFTAEHQEDFDTAYMRALFDYGRQLGRKGYPWHKAPPGLTAEKRP